MVAYPPGYNASGPTNVSSSISIGDIRTELGMGTTSNFSLTNSSIGGVAGYPPLNVYSYFKPKNTTPDINLNSWRGYNHTINTYFLFYDWVGFPMITMYYYGPNQSLQTSIPHPVSFTLNITLQLSSGPFNLPAFTQYVSPSQYGPFGYNLYFPNIYPSSIDVTINSIPTYVQMQPFGSPYPTPYIGTQTALP